ncbi:MAG: hypothetical protein P8013_12275 [Candidatus Sulfobium sp.]
MIFLDLFYVLVITLVLTAVFAVGFRKQRTWPVVLVFFVILFLATWAAGVWITPAASLPGVSWVSYVIVGLLFALLLTALIPLSRSMQSARAREAEEKAIAIVVFDLFFWILVIGLIAAIIVRYVRFSY